MSNLPWYTARLWNGMDFFGWLRLLARNRFAVSPSRLPRAFVITLFSIGNTTLRWGQHLRFGRRIAELRIDADPIFIVGHWRTGTTMLHELLALDRRHRCPTTYECLIPNHFLISERLARRWLWFMLPRTRPMDNVRLSFDKPQEDEAALCNLGTPSPFLTVAFPNRPRQHPRYVDMEGLSQAELERWERALRSFLKHVLFKRPGQLVLKSPQHTFRLKTLARMFPEARFVHLVRDPYVLLPSTVHFWTEMYKTYGLQNPKLECLQDFVFDTLALMHEKYREGRQAVSSDRIYELRYEDLVRDPLEAMRALYDYFQWPGFDAAEPAIRQYAARAKRYRTNRYEVSPELRETIARRWAPYIEEYGYSDDEAI
jgi:hypothetical protein